MVDKRIGQLKRLGVFHKLSIDCRWHSHLLYSLIFVRRTLFNRLCHVYFPNSWRGQWRFIIVSWTLPSLFRKPSFSLFNLKFLSRGDYLYAIIISTGGMDCFLAFFWVLDRTDRVISLNLFNFICLLHHQHLIPTIINYII